MNEPDAKTKKAKINLETAQTAWTELERFFAQGSVIWVNPALDLVDTAYAIAEDDSEKIKHWMKMNKIAQVRDAQAKTWHKQDAFLWTVVVRPLILVQEISE